MPLMTSASNPSTSIFTKKEPPVGLWLVVEPAHWQPEFFQFSRPMAGSGERLAEVIPDKRQIELTRCEATHRKDLVVDLVYDGYPEEHVVVALGSEADQPILHGPAAFFDELFGFQEQRFEGAVRFVRDDRP
jgi:hypothetical protein